MFDTVYKRVVLQSAFFVYGEEQKKGFLLRFLFAYWKGGTHWWVARRRKTAKNVCRVSPSARLLQWLLRSEKEKKNRENRRRRLEIQPWKQQCLSTSAAMEGNDCRIKRAPLGLKRKRTTRGGRCAESPALALSAGGRRLRRDKGEDKILTTSKEEGEEERRRLRRARKSRIPVLVSGKGKMEKNKGIL